jgi:hypothetical protein
MKNVQVHTKAVRLTAKMADAYKWYTQIHESCRKNRHFKILVLSTDHELITARNESCGNARFCERK